MNAPTRPVPRSHGEIARQCQKIAKRHCESESRGRRVLRPVGPHVADLRGGLGTYRYQVMRTMTPTASSRTAIPS
jgi:hypothetical protein